MKKIRVLKGILARTHAANMLAGYFMFVLVAAGIITAAEPEITSYGEALWYCYAVISTAGFGDVVAATVIGKVVSVILTVYSFCVPA